MRADAAQTAIDATLRLAKRIGATSENPAPLVNAIKTLRELNRTILALRRDGIPRQLIVTVMEEMIITEHDQQTKDAAHGE